MIAHKFVSFQSGGYLIGCTLRTVWYFLGAQHLANAAEINWLRAIMIQSDNVLDRSAQVRFMAGRKKHSGRTDIFCKTGYGYACSTRARDREW